MSFTTYIVEIQPIGIFVISIQMHNNSSYWGGVEILLSFFWKFLPPSPSSNQASDFQLAIVYPLYYRATEESQHYNYHKVIEVSLTPLSAICIMKLEIIISYKL